MLSNSLHIINSQTCLQDEDTNTDEDASPVKAPLPAATPTPPAMIRKLPTPISTPKSATGSPVTPAGKFTGRRTISTVGNRITVKETPVVRILNKRQSVKRRGNEYLVKWVDVVVDTWEPLTHLEKCMDLINEYESKVLALQQKTPENIRPVRNSKVRALDQVKQWCSDGSGAAGAVDSPNELKRKIGAIATDSEGTAGSQDESSPTPRQQMRPNSAVHHALQKGNVAAAASANTVAMRQKVPLKTSLNGSGGGSPAAGPGSGSSPRTASAEVLVATAKDKSSGVIRKPGVAGRPAAKKEAAVREVGKNETTSSGIVRVIGSSSNVVPRNMASTVPRLVQSPQTATSIAKPSIIKSSPLALRQQQQQQVARQAAATAASVAGLRPGASPSAAAAIAAAAANPRTPLHQYQMKYGMMKTAAGSPASAAAVTNRAVPSAGAAARQTMAARSSISTAAAAARSVQSRIAPKPTTVSPTKVGKLRKLESCGSMAEFRNRRIIWERLYCT